MIDNSSLKRELSRGIVKNIAEFSRCPADFLMSISGFTVLMKLKKR
jgi:hypothetical protein